MEPVGGELDPMVGHAVLGEVVGADLLGPLPRPHLGPPGRRLLLLRLLLGLAEEPGSQIPHGLLPVLELGPLLLGGHDDTRGEVGDPNGGVGRVHRLPTGAG